MKNLKLYDSVVLVENHYNIEKGSIGTVVFDLQNDFFEIEFHNESSFITKIIHEKYLDRKTS